MRLTKQERVSLSILLLIGILALAGWILFTQTGFNDKTEPAAAHWIDGTDSP